jgi:serine/threonine protein kinase
MAAARERKLPQLHLRLDVPTSCAFRCPAPVPAVTAETPSTSAAARPDGEFRQLDFDRLSVLGSGNGGIVHKVSHRRTSALYALKIIYRGHPGAADEVEVVRRVDSPHIVRCRSVLPTASGDSALLLELMDGGSLDSLVGSVFPEAALAEVASQALSGLAYLRSRRVVHRDMKPANLLVSRAGQVKIGDFGIAEVVSRAGNYRAAYEGTAAYMSPERFDTERWNDDGEEVRVDPYAVDVWGLGLIVLELLMGRYPLLPAGQKPTWTALMWAICFGELPTIPEGAASPALRDFVAACLQKDPRKRASVAELQAHPFVAGRDVAASRRALCQVIEQRCR